MNTQRFAISRRTARGLLAIGLFAAAAAGRAGPLEDRVRAALAPPAAIIAHAEDLHLTLAQRDTLIRLAEDYQRRVDRLEVELDERTEALVALLEAERIDTAAATAAFGEVHRVEGEIKRLHLELWIRANAELRPAQRREAIERAASADARGR